MGIEVANIQITRKAELVLDHTEYTIPDLYARVYVWVKYVIRYKGKEYEITVYDKALCRLSEIKETADKLANDLKEALKEKLLVLHNTIVNLELEKIVDDIDVVYIR